MKTIRVGVVGTGYLGKFHAQKYAAMPDVELTGVVDTDLTRAREISATLGTQAFGSIQELIGKVDAVSIVTPTPYHFEVSREFLNHNVDVLIEKPMTTSLAEADALIQLAEHKGLIIQVGHLERFNPAVTAVKDIIKQPRFIESHRLSMFQPRGTDVSVVLDLMIHDIDIILNFVHSEVKTIHAAGIPVISPNVDIANARLEFTDGCVANVTASRISMKTERKIRLFQRDAYISLNFAAKDITIIRQHKDAPTAEPQIIPGMDIQTLSFAQGDALDDELKSFVNSVRQRSEAEVTGKMGRDALKVALSIMDQIRQSAVNFM